MSTIGDRLKNARENKMLSQVQVYKDTGIHNKTLSGYERSVSQPDLDTIVLLASYYGVSTDYLLIGKKSNNLINKNSIIKAKSLYKIKDEYDKDKELIKDIFSLPQKDIEEIKKLVELYKIKNEYEKKTKK